MNENKTESLSASSIIYHILRTGAVGISLTNISRTVKQDSYISIIIGIITGLIPIAIYLYIMNTYKDLSIIEINEKVFGKKMGTVINIALSIFIYSFSAITLWNLADFTNSQFLNETPTFVIMFIFLIPVIYILCKGIITIARTSLLIFYINVIVYLFIIICLVGEIDLTNMLPFMESKIPDILTGSYSFIAYNILPFFILTIIPKNSIKNKEKFNKQSLIMYILCSLVTLSVCIFVIGIFGINLASVLLYPEYHVLKRISIFSTIERIESILSITWILSFFITITMGLYYVNRNIQHLTNVKKTSIQKIISIVISILLLIISEYSFTNLTQAQSFLRLIYPHLIWFFLLIIPAVIAIMCKIKKKAN